MNKTDLFQEKIRHSGRHLRLYFSEYQGNFFPPQKCSSVQFKPPHPPPHRSRRGRGHRSSFHHSHVLVVQPQPRQTRVPPLHHGNGHGQRSAGLPHGRGSDRQRQPGIRPAAVTVYYWFLFKQRILNKVFINENDWL